MTVLILKSIPFSSIKLNTHYVDLTSARDSQMAYVKIYTNDLLHPRMFKLYKLHLFCLGSYPIRKFQCISFTFIASSFSILNSFYFSIILHRSAPSTSRPTHYQTISQLPLKPPLLVRMLFMLTFIDITLFSSFLWHSHNFFIFFYYHYYFRSLHPIPKFLIDTFISVISSSI